MRSSRSCCRLPTRARTPQGVRRFRAGAARAGAGSLEDRGVAREPRLLRGGGGGGPRRLGAARRLWATAGHDDRLPRRGTAARACRGTEPGVSSASGWTCIRTTSAACSSSAPFTRANAPKNSPATSRSSRTIRACGGSRTIPSFRERFGCFPLAGSRKMSNRPRSDRRAGATRPARVKVPAGPKN